MSKRLLLTLLIVGIGLFAKAQGSLKSEPFYLGGIQVNEADYDQWAHTIEKAGMNTVEVTVYAKQGDWDSDNIWWDETDAGVVREVQAAKKAGLKVILILRVALDHAFHRNKFLWHGMIMPRNEPLIDSWFKKYRQFTLQWAKFAAEEKIDALVIGSELNALTATIPLEEYPPLIQYYHSTSKQNLVEKRALKFEDRIKEQDLWVRGFDNYQNLEEYLDDRIHTNREWSKQVAFGMMEGSLFRMNVRRRTIQKHWSGIAADCRTIYKGQLSYAANFDNYHEVGFWSELDFIGINAYFPLRDANKQDLSDEEMKTTFNHSWHKIFDQIDDFREEQKLGDKPMLFTELGYIYRKNTSIEPWKGFGFSVVGNYGRERLIVWSEQEKDHKERSLAVHTLYDVVKSRRENLIGILYWKLTTHDYHIPIEPFVLHIAPTATDPLQKALARFLKEPF